MRRRDCIPVLGAAIWMGSARAQQGHKINRIGILTPAPSDAVRSPNRLKWGGGGGSGRSSAASSIRMA